MRNPFSKLSALEPYIFSLLVLSLSTLAAINLAYFHSASASQVDKPAVVKDNKPEEQNRPIAFARFPKADALLVSQAIEDTLPCRQSPAFQGVEASSALEPIVDFCAPSPKLTSAQEAPDTLRTKWRLPKSPSKIIWQQNVAPSQKLVVELIDSDGLPWPSRLEIAKLGTRESVQIIPSYELSTEREMLLIGNLYNAGGQRIENWVLPISVDNGSTTSLPWNTTSLKRTAAVNPKK